MSTATAERIRKDVDDRLDRFERRLEDAIAPDRGRAARAWRAITPDRRSRSQRLADALDARRQATVAVASDHADDLSDSLESAKRSVAAAEEAVERAAERVAERTRRAADRVAGYVDEHVDEETVRIWAPRVGFALTGFLVGFALGWLATRRRANRTERPEEEVGLAQAPRTHGVGVPRERSGLDISRN